MVGSDGDLSWGGLLGGGALILSVVSWKVAKRCSGE